jgi:hypothetical protein
MDSMEQDLGSRQVLFEELDQMAEDVPGSSASMSAADESQEPTKAEGVEAECQTDIEGFLLRGLVSIHRFKSSPEAVKLFTGFSDFDHFLYLYQCLGPAAEHLTYKSQSLDAKDELFLCLMKLRMNKDDVELGILFGISKSTAGRIFTTWLNFLYYQFKEIDLFLPKDIVKQYMPDDFDSKYPETRDAIHQLVRIILNFDS